MIIGLLDFAFIIMAEGLLRGFNQE